MIANSFLKTFLSKQPSSDSGTTTRLPVVVVAFIIIFSILPIVLNWLGIDFTSPTIEDIAIDDMATRRDRRFFVLSGSFLHVFLECVAATVAMLTVALAYSHYKIKKDPIIPVICTALLLAGALDFFHILTAARLIRASAQTPDLIPFTWTLCRFFNSAICIIGISIIHLLKHNQDIRKQNRVLLGNAIVFAVLVFFSIYYSYTAEELPQVRFPEAEMYRPWDFFPLVGFIISFVIFYNLDQKRPSPFIQSLVLGTIPNIGAQLHIFYGSTGLFDNHFNIAHYLKILAYLAPFIGLIYEHILTYRQVERLKDQLQVKNSELDDFVHAASHDLKEPLRGIHNQCQFILEDYSHKPLDTKGIERTERVAYLSQRMDTLLSRLLEYARLGQEKIQKKETNLNEILEDSKLYLKERIEESNAKIIKANALPNIKCHREKVLEVFNNLISNAIKYNESQSVSIEIGSSRQDSIHNGKIQSRNVIYVKDNGIGIAPEQYDRIFKIFKRLHQKQEFGGGSGAGLTIVKKIVEQHGGEIWLESKLGQGTTFFFTFGESIK